MDAPGSLTRLDEKTVPHTSRERRVCGTVFSLGMCGGLAPVRLDQPCSAGLMWSQPGVM